MQFDWTRVSAPNDVSALDGVSWPVETDRLTLRPARIADTAATWRYRQLDSVNRWITAAPPTLDAYRERFEAPDAQAKTLVVALNGVVIGDLMLAVEDAWAQAEVVDAARGTQAELGWAFDPEHAGLGYATEAVSELLRIGFEDLGLRRVVGQCFAENAPSRRLMERLGMRLESHLVKDSLHRSGTWMDTAGYALLAEEWVPRHPGSG